MPPKQPRKRSSRDSGGGRERAGRPAGADPDRQRALILEAALGRFARQGFGAATLREIAADAGVAHGLIRHYFRNKPDLYRAAADHLFTQVASALATQPDSGRVRAGSGRAGSGSDPMQLLEARVRAFVHLSARLPHLAGFMLQAGLAGGERFDDLIERHVRPLYQQMLRRYGAAVDAGRAADLDPVFVFIIATNAVSAPFAQAAVSRALSGRDLYDPAVADAYADTLVRVLLHGVTRSTPRPTRRTKSGSNR